MAAPGSRWMLCGGVAALLAGIAACLPSFPGETTTAGSPDATAPSTTATNDAAPQMPAGNHDSSVDGSGTAGGVGDGATLQGGGSDASAVGGSDAAGSSDAAESSDAAGSSDATGSSDAALADAAFDAEPDQAGGCASSNLTCDGGACVDPMTDEDNCGECGHSCLGGSCKTGLCQPIVLGTFPDNGLGIAIDSADVFFTNGRTSVYACPLSGCPATPNAINTGFTNTTQLHYSSSTGALYVGDIGAGTETSLTTSGGVNWQAAESLNDPQGETEDATYLYVGDENQIDRFAKSSGTFTVLANGIAGFVWGVWYDSATSNVFGAVNGTSGGGLIVSCPVAGTACTQITLATNGPAFETMVIGSIVYWVDGGDPAMNNTNGGLFMANSADLGNVQAVAAGASYGFALALTADATNIYFTSGSSGNVYRCAIAGCAGAPTTIATGQGSARAIVTDSVAVYWVNDAGQVVKVAK